MRAAKEGRGRRRCARRGLIAALLVAIPLPSGCRHSPAVTFNRDVAPLLDAHCTPCHRPGEVAPFPLLTYEDARKRASQIVTVTGSRYMPPWLPEPGYGHFLGERRLTEAELATLRAWVEQGTPEGPPAERPPPPRWTEGWQLGEPDLVVESPEPFVVPAEGPDVFRSLVLPIPVDRPRWVRTVEFRSDNPPAVHHVILQVDESGASRRRDQAEAGPGFGGMDLSDSQMPDGQFLGWTPGRVPDAGLDGVAWRLRPGTDLVLQLHLPPTGKPEPVRVEVGFFFTDEPPTRHPFGLMLGSQAIDIPPGDAAYRLADSFRLPVDVELLGLYPHAHYLGKEVRVFATLPQGRRQDLLWIRDWDFNWQDEYRCAEPVPLPAGTLLTLEVTYDNSAANPRNPHHPPRRVRYGAQSSDEMGFLLLRLLPGGPADRDRLEIAQLEHLLAKKPGEWRARGSLGKLLLAGGELEAAIAQLRRALEDAPADATLLTHLGQALGRAGHLAEAFPLLEEAVRRNPGLAAARTNLGVALELRGQAAAAERELRRALELEPGSPEAHLNLARLLTARGRPREAADHLRQALGAVPAGSPLADHLHRRLAELEQGG